MIEIKLSTGEKAVVNEGVWTVEGNAELSRVLNSPAMQPPEDGHYAPTPDARMAEHVLAVWGGEWIASDEHHPQGKVY